MVPLGPKCNASEIMLSMYCYCYLGISLEDMDDAYCLRKNSGAEALSTTRFSYNCTAKFAATRQIPGGNHHPPASHTLFVNNDRAYSFRLVCSLVNSRYAESSKCRTLSVTGRVRVICSRGVSKVYIPFLLYRIERNLNFIHRTWPRQNRDLSDSLPYWRYC
jgi:hypothetical protein